MKTTTTLFAISAVTCMLVAGCGNTKPTKEVFEVATKGIRGKMKSPSSARFTVLSDKATTTEHGDTTIIEDDSTMFRFVKDSLVAITGHFESANGFGVLLPGTFTVVLKHTDDGAWVGMTGSPDIDFQAE